MTSLREKFRSSLVTAAAVVALAGALPLHADLSVVDIFKNITYAQTGGSTVTPSGFFANAEAFSVNPGDFDSATATFPAGSTIPGGPTVTLPMENSTEFGIGPAYSTLAGMNSDFPFGTYTFTATNSGTSTSETASLDYTVDAYTSDIPALDAATFDALQGLDPTQPFTFNFNSFTPSPNASVGITFLSIFGTSFGTSNASTATSANMAANTLLPNTTYTYELDFSDRINGFASDNPNVPTVVGFDVRTDGTFTTGPGPVPEPTTTLLIGLGLVAVAAGINRKKRH